MDTSKDFSFGNDSVAKSYDTILVPSLFEPWANMLIQENKPWSNRIVLDLACGTGVVTKMLVQNVQPKGRVFALDINTQMLELAKLKCKEWANFIEFIEGSANDMNITNRSIDTVVCQQGFQFFPDKKAAATEIYRVLKPGGKAIISTWCSVEDCEIFGVICETLESINQSEISKMMRIPFDLMSKHELLASFNEIGFSSIEVCTQHQKYYLKGGLESAITLAYATPIGPNLKALSIADQEKFKSLLKINIQKLNKSDGSIGQMASNVLCAVK